MALTKGVVEARDPHDSPEVDAIRQKLLEDYAGRLFSKIEQEETPQFVDHIGRRKLF